MVIKECQRLLLMHHRLAVRTGFKTGVVPAPGDPTPDRITNLSDTSTLVVGMTVTGADIPAGATIASVDSATNSITLSAPVTTGTGTISQNETGDIPAPGDPTPNQITNLSDTSTLAVGMTVTGTNIPAGATIASIDSANNTITLSAPVTTGTGTVGDTLSFLGEQLTFRMVQAEARVGFTPTYPSQLEFEKYIRG